MIFPPASFSWCKLFFFPSPSCLSYLTSLYHHVIGITLLRFKEDDNLLRTFSVPISLLFEEKKVRTDFECLLMKVIVVISVTSSSEAINTFLSIQ